MEWYQLVALVAMAITLLFCLSLFLRLIQHGKPKDFSKASGSVAKGVAYSCTTAMMPTHKESAYMHLPTYSAGIIFHIGTFASLLLFILSFFPISFPQWIGYGLCAGLCISTLCGVLLFVKRITNKELQPFTSLDNYLSNGFTTLFQLMSALIILFPAVAMYYYLAASLLLLYIPVGKLKHVVYFFAARYHLGFFYGHRNSWPVSKQKCDE